MIPATRLQGQDLAYLESEISILKGSLHPAIVMLYDVLRTKNNLYLIMEFCEGGDLKKYI